MTHAVTPEPQYATSSPPGSSGSSLVPRRVERSGDPARARVDRVRLAAEALRAAGVDDHELLEAPRQLVGLDRVVFALPRHELGRLDLLLARARAARASHRARARRSRRGRSGAVATRAARRCPCSRRRRRRRRRRSRPARPSGRSPPRLATGGDRAGLALPPGRRPRRETRRPGCARRGRARAPGPASRAPSGSPRTGSAQAKCAGKCATMDACPGAPERDRCSFWAAARRSGSCSASW